MKVKKQLKAAKAKFMKLHFPIMLFVTVIGYSIAWGEDKAPVQLLSEKITFVGRRAQIYKVKFSAKPDKRRFQIQRIPSVKWPERANFIIGIGDTSTDNQIRIDGFAKKDAKNEKGILVDASILPVTFLPTGKKYQLTRNVTETIPIYYAELRNSDTPKKSFFVKKGDTFNDIDTTQYRVKEVSKDSVVITLAEVKEDSTEVEIKRK